LKDEHYRASLAQRSWVHSGNIFMAAIAMRYAEF